MTKNSFNFSEGKNILQKYLLTPLWMLFTQIMKVNTEFNRLFPTTSQVIQLTFVYFFAFLDLTHSILSQLYSLGQSPEFLTPFRPFLNRLLTDPLFQIFASPEKVYFLSFLVLEFMVVRKTGFSKLVRYNILLVFSLLMMQQLVISWWDVMFHRAISQSAQEWAYEGNPFLFNDLELVTIFFFNTFFWFTILYIYLYIRSVQGKFATIPYLGFLTDSVAFWLRIKTPTMRFGQGKKKGKK
jgi:hypothetical protein